MRATAAPMLTGMLEPIAAAHRQGRPVVVVARNSGSDGKGPRQLAVNDLLETANELAKCGLDIRCDLPAEEDLLELLRQATPVRSRTRERKSFINRFVTIDLRAQHGVYVIVSVGTSKKLDDAAVQPFVNYLANVVSELEPCLVFARRLDRITRRAWALGAVMLTLTEIDGFIGDAVFGLSRAAGVESLLVFFRATSSEDEATKIPTQSRIGMRRRTGESLANGTSTYAVAHPVPPGFVTFRSLQGGSIGPRMITFDTPACLPDRNQVAAGLPEVFSQAGDGSTERVDQVANVRWALARLGAPDWPDTRIARGLAARGFSTDGLRRTNGPDAAYGAETAHAEPHRIMLSLKQHLDLYETGVMRLELGIDGHDAVIITDCFPPDGQRWAAPDDFARIRQAKLDRQPPARRRSALSGLPACVDNIPCVLILRTTVHGLRFTPVVASDYRNGGRQVSRGTPVLITADDIIEPFVEAIIAAGDEAFPLIDDETETDLVHQAELTTVRTRLRVLVDRRRSLEQQLLERTTDGQPRVTGALPEHLNTEYNTLADLQIPDAEADIRRLETDLEARRREALSNRAGVAAQRVLELIAGLRDHTNTDYKDLVHRCIDNLSIATTRHELQRRVWWIYDISFDIVITNRTGHIRIPVRRVCQYGDAYDPETIACDTMHQLVHQRTTWQALSPSYDALIRRRAATKVGLTGRTFMLPNVTDPWIARLAALALTHPGQTDRIAAQTGEPPALIERILTVHRTATRSVWRTRPQPTLATWYRLAWTGAVDQARHDTHCDTTWASARNMFYAAPDRNEWSLGDNGYRLAPCPHCSSTRRSPASIPEPVGLVCIDCERDQAGFPWPLATYAHLLLVSLGGPAAVTCNGHAHASAD